MTLNTDNYINSDEIYQQVFERDLSLIWGRTKFANEIEELCYARATAIFLKTGHWSNYWRRRLMYHAVQPFFSTNESDDFVNKAFSRLPNDNQLVRRMVNNLCLTYSTEPNRELGDKAREQVEKANINKVLMQADQISYLCGSCLIRPFFKDGLLDFHLYTPDNYRIDYDEYGEIKEVWLSKAEPNTDNKYLAIDLEVWLPDKVVTKKTTKIQEQESNEYGFLPFVELKGSQDKTYHNQSAGMWELCELQINANMLELAILENSILASVGIWHGDNIKFRGKNLKISPSKILITETDSAESPATLQYISAELNSEELQSIKAQYVKDKLKDYGLPSSIIDEGGVLSGAAMEADRIELNEQRRRRLIEIEDFDAKLFQLIKRIADIDNVPFEEQHSIAFKPVDVVIDPLDKIEVLKEKYALGLISKIDMLRELGHKGTNEDLLNYLEEVNDTRNREQSSVEATPETEGLEDARTDAEADTDLL